MLSNNVRSRAHLWSLIIISLAPAPLALFNGFYQFFQEPQHMLGAMTDYGLDLNADFLGRATGAFADPNSFAAFIDTFALFVDYGGRHSLAKDFALTGFISL